MAPLTKGEQKVVRKWWKCCEDIINDNKIQLDYEYRRAACTDCEKLDAGFREIFFAQVLGTIVARGSKDDGSPVILSVWEHTPTVVGTKERCFQVHRNGTYTVKATPIDR